MANGATYITDTTAVTGSFSKIQIVGGSADTKLVAANFENIQFGIGTVANNDGVNNQSSPYKHFNTVTNVEVTGSITIDGPIGGFKLANGSVLAYNS
jgi:N-methylhydantoinase B/oxoprolinase/acetone carboxylase alpha subunit